MKEPDPLDPPPMSVGKVNDRIVTAFAGSTVTFMCCTTPLYVAVITAEAGLVTEAIVMLVDTLCTPLLSVAELGTDASCIFGHGCGCGSTPWIIKLRLHDMALLKSKVTFA